MVTLRLDAEIWIKVSRPRRALGSVMRLVGVELATIEIQVHVVGKTLIGRLVTGRPVNKRRGQHPWGEISLGGVIKRGVRQISNHNSAFDV